MAHAVGGFLLTVVRQWMTNIYIIILIIHTSYYIDNVISCLLFLHVYLYNTTIVPEQNLHMLL